MFGLGGGEVFLVVLLAVLFIGPKDLPRVATQLGKYYRKLKETAQELKTTVEREIDLSESTTASKNASDHE